MPRRPRVTVDLEPLRAVARPAAARARQRRLGPRHPGRARRAALPALRRDPLGVPDRAARRGRARAADHDGAARRRARRPRRPPPAAAARPGRARRARGRARRARLRRLSAAARSSTCSAACWPASARCRTSRARRSCRTSSTPERLRSALALNFGLYQLTMVIGPAIGGLLIGALRGRRRLRGRRGELPGDGRRRRSSMAPAAAAGRAAPSTSPVLRSIADGLRFVRGNHALLGSFAIDLVAMTFGMPRALFAGARGQRLPRGRRRHRPALRGGLGGRDGRGADHRLDRARAAARAIIVIWAVAVWGAAIALAGRRRLALGGGDPARGRGRGGQRQRGLPLARSTRP